MAIGRLHTASSDARSAAWDRLLLLLPAHDAVLMTAADSPHQRDPFHTPGW